MYRLSPRIKVALPAKLNTQSENLEMLITDLSVNGAFLNSRSFVLDGKLEPDSPVLLRYSVAGNGNLEHKGKILRKENGGYAVNLCTIDIESRHRLWSFIMNNLSGNNECPFCGQRFSHLPESCNKCGWELNFSSPGYFKYYEKTYALKNIYEKLSQLDLDHLNKVLGFVDADIVNTNEDEDNQEFVGTSTAMLDVFSNIRKVAPTDLTVLILGESGTGKELTAQAIHERSARKDKPFVAINCGAIPENLLEAELFGYEKGAFTGAYTSKKGKFEHADGGSIFLDEIGEMPFSLQVKLLRFLQDKNVERVGAVVGKNVDVRLIAATNRDLSTAIADGKFRADLYYRLDEFTIQLPPVRERGNDKIILARFFLNKFNREMRMTKTFTKDAVDAIQSYSWPGNVRELINKIRRAMVMSSDNSLAPIDLDLEIERSEKVRLNNRLSDAVAQLEIEKIKEVLNSCGHNVSKAADILGITRQTLHRRLKIHRIK